jgi:hydrogenase maturation factor HypF (carbamoyltransferase family)
LFDPFDFTDDTAGAKSCFKCGNPFGEPVYVSFSTQAIGCTACCKNPQYEKEKAEKERLYQEAMAKCIRELKERRNGR